MLPPGTYIVTAPLVLAPGETGEDAVRRGLAAGTVTVHHQRVSSTSRSEP